MAASNFEKSLALLLKDEVKNHLSYNDKTGIFYWLRDSNNKQRLSGNVAGFIGSSGYIRIKLFGVEYAGHRLAWFYTHGRWPKAGLEIDHINGIKDDNRICNLREVTPSQQRMNSKINKDNTSGHRGLVLDKRNKRWRVFIQREFVGSFRTKQAAIIAHNTEFNARFGPEYRREF